MSEEIAPECRERCVYGTCRKTMSDPYGCGGCCACLGGCQVAYENTPQAAQAARAQEAQA